MTKQLFKHTLKRWAVPFIMGCFVAGFGVSEWQNYTLRSDIAKPRTEQTSMVRADTQRSLYNNMTGTMKGAVRANDLSILHHVGNSYAMIMNNEAKNNGLKPIYKQSSDGNYWSYFYDHYALMSDDYNIKDENSGNIAYTGSVVDRTSTSSGIIANESVLRSHGIKSGVNFEFHNKDDNGKTNTPVQYNISRDLDY